MAAVLPARNPNAPRKGHDIQASVILTFEEAAHGCTKKVTLNRQQTCPDCGGTGCEPRAPAPRPAPECGGRGYVVTQQRTPFGVMQSQQPCPHCGGRGTIIKQPLQDLPRHRQDRRPQERWRSRSPPVSMTTRTLHCAARAMPVRNGGPAGDVIVHVTVKTDADV